MNTVTSDMNIRATRAPRVGLDMSWKRLQVTLPVQISSVWWLPLRDIKVTLNDIEGKRPLGKTDANWMIDIVLTRDYMKKVQDLLGIILDHGEKQEIKSLIVKCPISRRRQYDVIFNNPDNSLVQSFEATTNGSNTDNRRVQSLKRRMGELEGMQKQKSETIKTWINAAAGLARQFTSEWSPVNRDETIKNTALAVAGLIGYFFSKDDFEWQKKK